MKLFGWLLRTYSYLFHLASALLLLGIAVIASFSHQPLNLTMLPFENGNLLLGTYEVALGGLLAIFLSASRWLKAALPLWAAATVVALVKGYFFSAYAFSSRQDLSDASWYIAGAFLAFLGALWILKPRRGRLYS